MSKIGSEAEALLLLSEGLDHAVRNPNIKHYKPHEKQAIFHSSKKKKKLYIGGNRSGKTTGGVTEAIWRATNRHPFRPDLNALGPTRGRVVAVSLIDGVEKIIHPQYKQWLYPSAIRGGAWETAYDKTLRTLNFTNGSTIEFMSYDQELEKFAGTSRHWVHFDEEPPKSIYIENMARLIDTDGDFWITMTPVEGMTWVYDDLYEPNEHSKDGPVEIIEINTLENPYLTRSAVESFIGSIDQDEQTSRISGEFVAVGGRIYKNFDPTVGGLHVLKEAIPADEIKAFCKGKMVIVSLDHGLNNPTSVHWTAVDKEGFCVTFWEHYKKEWTVDKHAAHINKTNRLFGITPDLYVADPSIQNRNPITGTSIHEEYIKYGIPFVLGNNDVKAGIVRFKRYLNPSGVKSDQHPLGLPRWICTPNCTWLIWELKKYKYKVYTNKKLNDTNNPFEEPQKKDDHACDEIRYMIMTRPDLRAQDTFEDQVNEAMQQLGAISAVEMDRHADPHDLESNPAFQQDHAIPNRLSDWEFDEHMGGVY